MYKAKATVFFLNPYKTLNESGRHAEFLNVKPVGT
jgi:hypothetical protein